jgi:pseudouridine synthase
MQVLLFNKPYGVIRQFRRSGSKPTLENYIPLPGYYPAGRLDTDSEGLLALTNDGKLQQRITDPRHKLAKPTGCRRKAFSAKPRCNACATGLRCAISPHVRRWRGESKTLPGFGRVIRR